MEIWVLDKTASLRVMQDYFKIKHCPQMQSLNLETENKLKLLDNYTCLDVHRLNSFTILTSKKGR